MGGLAGFALGGLLGSMLFGGGMGGGIGLMEILLIGGGIFLLFRMMKNRQAANVPAPSYGQGYGGGQPQAQPQPQPQPPPHAAPMASPTPNEIALAATTAPAE